MAKRFTDTDRWRKGPLRGLQAPYKLLWIYINDECNHAGIWVVDWDVAIIRTGLTTITFEKAKTALAAFIKDLGEEWFIPSFIDEQYNGVLNPENKVHASVIKILRTKSLFDEKFLDNSGEFDAPCKGHASPIQGAKYKNKDIDKDKDRKTGIGKTVHAREKKSKSLPILFSDCSVSELSAFETAFDGTDYSAFNLSYYHQALQNWSEAEGKRKIDWVATARSWMLRDAKEGKAAMQNVNLTNNQNGKSNSKTGQTGILNADHKRDLVQRVARAAGQGIQHDS